MVEKKTKKTDTEENLETKTNTASGEKKKAVKAKKNDDVSMGIRLEASLLKLKKFVDNLVDAYSATTNIEPHEAKEIVSSKAASFMNKGQYGKAIDEFNRLINLGKEDASIYYNLGVCCENEEMDEEAENAYKKAIEIDNAFADAYYHLGLIAIGNDNPKTAIQYLSKIVNNNGSSYDATYNLGVAYDKDKNYPRAIECFKKAITEEPKYTKTYKRLGYAYDAIQKHSEAVECFKKAMELEEI